MKPEIETGLERLFKSIQTFGSLTKEAENREKLYKYNDALMRSLCSILEDSDCDDTVKMQYFNTTMEQYAAAMEDLFPKLIGEQSSKPDEGAPKKTIGKSDPNRFDLIEEVQKFNPYHGKDGRFASANGFTSFTYAPGKSKAHDMAIAREKERQAAAGGGGGKPKENPLNDPETLGGAKQGNAMSRQEANGGKVNPNVDRGGGYHQNCQSCVVAYEARLRGYDVQAKPLGDDPTQRALMRNPQLAWEDPKTGRLASSIGGGDSITTPQKCREWMEKAVEPGARYALENVWKGRGTTAHIISCDKDSSGNLRFYDPQSGKTYQGSDIDSYLSRCKYEANVWGTKVNVSPRLTRIDNMAFNTDVANTAVEVAK